MSPRRGVHNKKRSCATAFATLFVQRLRRRGRGGPGPDVLLLQQRHVPHLQVALGGAARVAQAPPQALDPGLLGQARPRRRLARAPVPPALPARNSPNTRHGPDPLPPLSAPHRWGSPFPCKVPLCLAIGRPIRTPAPPGPGAEVSDELVDHYHALYVEELQARARPPAPAPSDITPPRHGTMRCVARDRGVELLGYRTVGTRVGATVGGGVQ